MATISMTNAATAELLWIISCDRLRGQRSVDLEDAGGDQAERRPAPSSDGNALRDALGGRSPSAAGTRGRAAAAPKA